MEYEEEKRVPEYDIPLEEAYKTQSVLREWLDSDKSIEKFEYILRGYKKNYDSQEWEYQENQEWMNDFGVNKVVGSIMGYLDTTLILSDLTDDEVRDLAYSFRIKMIKLLAMEYNKFNLDIQSYGSMVVNNCGSIVFFALKRARKFQTAKALQPNTQLIEQRIERKEPPREKRGFLSFLPTRGR